MTYVHVDDEGRREIRISDNDISHLGITRGTMWNGNPFYKLGYNVESVLFEALKSIIIEVAVPDAVKPGVNDSPV